MSGAICVPGGGEGLDDCNEVIDTNDERVTETGDVDQNRGGSKPMVVKPTHDCDRQGAAMERER